MIQTNERKLNKRHLTLIITAAALVLLIVAYVIIDAVINAGAAGNGGASVNNAPTVNTEIGESVYLNMAVAYPYIESSKIKSISIKSDIDTFHIRRDEDDDGNLLDHFLFFYEDEAGDTLPYLPEIVYSENNFDYTSLYAIDSSDSWNQYKVTYLCVALGAMTFGESIPIPAGDTDEEKEERRKMLNRYGLNVEDRETILVTYVDGGTEKSHRIYIGDKLITGAGYYFMLEGRDVVYTSGSAATISTVLSGFESFIHSRIVAEGLPSDMTAEPYLTTDYKQWATKYYTTEGKKVAPGSTVVALGNYKYPVYNSTSTSGGNGYRNGYGTDKLQSLDLDSLSDYPEFEQLIRLIESQSVGTLDAPISVTVISDLNEALLSDGTTNKYTYVISAIESVFGDSGEIYTEGTPVGESKLIKIEYRCYIDGSAVSTEPSHAVIDLDEESVITDSVREALRASSVGTLSTPITLDDVCYTEQTANLRDVQNVITEIVSIYDKNGKNQEKIGADSVVTYRYYNLMDGVKMGVADYVTLDLSTATEGFYLTLKNTLLGLGTGNVNLTINESVYVQPFSDFRVYTFTEICGFETKELISSFRFLNESERDAFYAESTYTNTLPAGNKYAGYAISDESCDAVVRLLGGINADGTTQVAAGLVGSQTVAVGLTPEVMVKYGLYDGHTVYFELPRMIVEKKDDDPDTLDYTWHDTLGFYLHISDVQPDGTRYIASEMYDIVVKIDAKGFEYLDLSFAEFWARRNLAMIDYKDIDNFSASFNMSDLVGSYNFALDHKTIYIGSDGGHYQTKPENMTSSEYDEVTVTASISGFVPGESSVPGVYSETELSKILAAEGRDSFILANLYNRVAGIPSGGYGLTQGDDTLGTASFKTLLFILYSTSYTGTVSPDEQSELLLSSPLVMSFSFDVYASSAYTYVYDFYRISDREILVCTYRVDDAGNRINPISDFTISTFAFKKIVANVHNLLNGVALEPDVGYGD